MICIMGLIATCLLVILGLVGHFQWTESLYAADVRKELTRIQKLGEPISNDSLEEWCASRSTTENRDQWQKLIEYVESKDFKDLGIGVDIFDYQAEKTGPDSPNWIGEPKYRDLLKQTVLERELLARLCENARPIHFLEHVEGPNTLLNHIQGLERLSKIVQVEFEIARKDNDAAAMLAAIQKQFAISIIGSEEPFSVSRMVCIRIRSRAIENIQLGVESKRFDASQLVALDRMLRDLRPNLVGWRDLIAGERACVMDDFYKPVTNTHPANEQSVLPRSHNDLLNYLSFMERIASVDVSSMDSGLTEVARITQELSQNISSVTLLSRRHWQGSINFFPAFDSVMAWFCKELTQIRIARLAIGVKRYQLLHGYFPDSIADLHEFDLDHRKLMPVGNKPFGFIRTEEKATLWGPKPELGASTGEAPFEVDKGTEDEPSKWRFLYWEIQK